MGEGERGVVGRGRGLSCTGVEKGSRGVIIREGAGVSCPGEGEGGGSCPGEGTRGAIETRGRGNTSAGCVTSVLSVHLTCDRGTRERKH